MSTFIKVTFCISNAVWNAFCTLIFIAVIGVPNYYIDYYIDHYIGGLIKMENESGGAKVASSFIWALALIIVVGMIVGALYYGGMLNNKEKKEIDINIEVPKL